MKKEIKIAFFNEKGAKISNVEKIISKVFLRFNNTIQHTIQTKSKFLLGGGTSFL